jgi:hypothetical protein
MDGDEGVTAVAAVGGEVEGGAAVGDVGVASDDVEVSDVDDVGIDGWREVCCCCCCC